MLAEKTFVATPKYPFKYSHQFEAAHEGLFLYTFWISSSMTEILNLTFRHQLSFEGILFAI